eukprot:jgi/Ulvmu1/10294/UM060_0096.1
MPYALLSLPSRLITSRYKSQIRLRAMQASASAAGVSWTCLGTPTDQLVLQNTLPTGQSFRWYKCEGEADFTGVVGERVVQMKQLQDDVSWRVIARGSSASPDDDLKVLSDYFNLEVDLAKLAKYWASQDPHYEFVNQRLFGCRMLRQDPVECLFQFICSSNNHISRIHGMVNHLCRTYGTKLEGRGDKIKDEKGMDIETWHAFPTIEQLQAATEADLRENGFGYRAAYICKTAQQLHEMPEGGREWLLKLRKRPFAEVIDELTRLAGVGPKVAACVALFACDKPEAIPVDTHVWRLACQRYLPGMRNKTLSPKLHPVVMQAFVKVFGEYAGWAHNALFISQLASHKHLLERSSGSNSSSASDTVDMERHMSIKPEASVSPQSAKPKKLAITPATPDPAASLSKRGRKRKLTIKPDA